IEGTYQETADPAKRLREGRWPTKLECKINQVSSTIWPPLGCGLGGSSLLYGAALERLEASDFAVRQTPAGEEIGWPYTYEELQPYYLEAEKLYSVCGTQDQRDTHSRYELRPPPAMSDCDRHLYQAMQAASLHPYRIHVGMKYEKDCLECGGYYCKRECKKDSRNSCIKPALATGNLTIMDQAEVEHIEADATSVKEIIVNRNGERSTLTGKIIVLAAGAYFTPVLMQRSVNQYWPNGIGNRHDQVGRYLMFHASDFIAIWPKGKFSRVGPQKTIAFRDFYEHQDLRLGELQSTGLTAGYGNILYFLKLKFDQSPFRKLAFLRPFLRIPAKIAAWLFSEATVFATIVEDHPYADNRVIYDAKALSSMRFEYQIRPELEER
ncbi:MAG TPA: GMC family oxidoreductase N-terminal domain-containing protein, partial [Pseudomonadales bacterium]|nr:GMC family oxidoreductase N-terminal domain-containing protein [Pseudomonadales bacterium]